jgi:hypothetical protein
MSLTFNKQVKGGSNNQIVEKRENNEQGKTVNTSTSSNDKGSLK